MISSFNLPEPYSHLLNVKYLKSLHMLKRFCQANNLHVVKL